MSWWGGGKKDEDPVEEKGFTDPAAAGFDSSPNLMASGGGGGGGAAADFQQFSMALQQQMLVQQAITDMAHRSFTKCVSNSRDSKLSGKEVACIHSATNKWLDSNEFMMGRLAKKQQQAAGAQQY